MTKLVTFDIATLEGRAPRRGYVLGDWATHKDKYNWVFTHRPTGLSICAPWIETKAPALEHLCKLHAEGPAPHVARILASCGGKWGGGS
jgi:hypothetical protein